MIKLLKRVKIKTLIRFSIIYVCILFLGISTYSSLSMMNITSSTRQMYNKPHINLSLIADVKSDVLSVITQFQQYSLTGTAIAEDAAEVIASVSENIITVSNNSSADMIESYNSLLVILTTWQDSASDIVNCIQTGRGYDIATIQQQTRDLVNNLDLFIVNAQDEAREFVEAAEQRAKFSQTLLLILPGLVVIMSLGMMVGITSSIGKPMKIITDVANQIANGNLKAEITIDNKNEFGLLANSFRTMQKRLTDIINDVDILLKSMSKGDFTRTPQAEYVGDFSELEKNLVSITASLSRTVNNIKRASAQVLSGANNISEGSDLLADGTAKQALSIEQLASMVNSISMQINENAANAAKADEMVKGSDEQIRLTSAQMNDMMSAMQQITEKSSQIEKIIKTIDDIAFQTNILALNAAVEAARAGEAGKGFAVVADEVRSLAGKSSDAAHGTNELIASTVEAVQNGQSYARLMEESIRKTVENANNISTIVNSISGSTVAQAEAANKINSGISEISTVVQSNSATAEQSSAAAEQLRKQAEELNNTAQNFKVN